MRKLKLIKGLGNKEPAGSKKSAKAQATGSLSDDGAAYRFKQGLEELRAIKTRDDYDKAVTRGVQFTIDGFRKRARIGNASMRSDHGDLFNQLNAVLDYIYPEILGVARNRKGRSRKPTAKSKKDAQKQAAEASLLRGLLDRIQRDYLDLLEEVRLLREPRA